MRSTKIRIIKNSSVLEQILSGNRRALSQAITLIESEAPEDHRQANLLLDSLLKFPPLKKGGQGGFLRIGLSGPPGAGKSSLIETLGLYLLQKSLKIAVLTIDPSSQISGGSLLGDKTRMQRLSQDNRVFIRPSPAKNYLGGVAQHTEETLLVCEAAGFDLILLESVGVGQSESDIASLVDILVLVLAPGAGDDLQGMKRGLFELSDMIVINKSDGDLEKPADQARLAYQHAFSLMGRSSTPVLCVSAHENTGIETLWDKIQEFKPSPSKQGFLLEQRFCNLAQQKLLSNFKSDPKVQTQLPAILNQVKSKKITAWQALQNFFLIILLGLGACNQAQTTVPQLIHQLQGKDPQKAYQALIKLTQIANPSALEAVIDYSARKLPEIRIQAILAARQFKSKKALPWLFVLSTGDPDETVRNAAHEAFLNLE